MTNINPLICAWVGRNNFGDELLAYALRKEIARNCSVGTVHYFKAGDYPVYVHPMESKIEKCKSDFTGTFEKSYLQFSKNSPFSNAIIYGGGSIFHSENSIRWKHKLLKSFLKVRNSETVLKGCAGVSFGPFENRAAEDMAGAFIRELDFVVCRDDSSTEFASATAKNVDVYGGNDLAYSAYDVTDDLFVTDKVSGLVGLSFILKPELSDYEKSIQVKKMLSIVDRLTENGFSVRLVSLYTAGKYNDHLLHEALLKDSKYPDRVELHHYAGDIFTTVKAIGECEFFISMRLHGLITSHLTGTKFLPLNLHPKVEGFCRKVGVQARVDIDCSRDLIQGELDCLLNGSLSQNEFGPQYFADQNRETYQTVFSSMKERTH